MAMPVLDNEENRIKILGRYEILDSAPEFAYDEITELAAGICKCPVAFISIISEDRQWFKSRYGIPSDLTETPRDMSVCTTTISQSDLLIVSDLSKDNRFSDLPSVRNDPSIRFYAGMPLITPDGYALGTICTVDFEPRELEDSQAEAMRRLSHQVMAQLELKRSLIEMGNAIKELESTREQLAAEKAKADHLLLNILPEMIADELKATEHVEPRFYSSASIMFGDFSGFTKLSENMEPKSLIDLLDQYFSAFDGIVAQHNVEKIKTIGDAYMCASGLPAENRGHAIEICLAGLEIQRYLTRANTQREKLRMPRWDLRLGIHTGPVMAGVVGKYKFTYDIWGDSVNVAALMEQASEPGQINISETTYQKVKDLFEIKPRGTVATAKKGDITMYFLDRLKPEFSEDAEGTTPNKVFHEKCDHLMIAYSA